jgi:hypothetical protein
MKLSFAFLSLATWVSSQVQDVPVVVDIECASQGEDLVCPISSEFEFGGDIFYVSAELSCNIPDASQLESASQSGACGCSATLQDSQGTELAALQCDCFLCPQGSDVKYAYTCQTEIAGPCKSFNCDGTCNEQFIVWNNSGNGTDVNNEYGNGEFTQAPGGGEGRPGSSGGSPGQGNGGGEDSEYGNWNFTDAPGGQGDIVEEQEEENNYGSGGHENENGSDGSGPHGQGNDNEYGHWNFTDPEDVSQNIQTSDTVLSTNTPVSCENVLETHTFQGSCCSLSSASTDGCVLSVASGTCQVRGQQWTLEYISNSTEPCPESEFEIPKSNVGGNEQGGNPNANITNAGQAGSAGTGGNTSASSNGTSQEEARVIGASKDATFTRGSGSSGDVPGAGGNGNGGGNGKDTFVGNETTVLVSEASYFIMTFPVNNLTEDGTSTQGKANKTAELCMEREIVSGDEEGDVKAQTYTACLLLPELVGSGEDDNIEFSLPEDFDSFNMPEDCVGGATTSFNVTSGTTEVCVDVSELILLSSIAIDVEPANESKLRRRLQVDSLLEEASGSTPEFSFMVDNLNPSSGGGVAGDRFYSSNDAQGRGPKLSIITTVDIAANATSMPTAEGSSGSNDSTSRPYVVTTSAPSDAPNATEVPVSGAVSRTSTVVFAAVVSGLAILV